MNRIPNTSGNAHPENTGGKKHSGPDPHASKHHKRMNKHHGMKHAMGETAPYGNEETGSGNHEDCYGPCDE